MDPEEAAAIADAEADIEEEVETPPLGPRPPEPQVLDLDGGSVSITLLDGAIVLNAATPKPGFVADLSFDRADELTITFWDGVRLFAVIATITGEGELDLAWEQTGR